MAETTLPAAPVSSRLAREFVVSVTGGREDPRVALVVTELVTNAVVHGRSRPHLRVEWDGHAVRLRVADDGPGRPEVRELDAMTTSGRGLALVARVADDWGVEDWIVEGRRVGKAVWACIDLRY